MARPQKKGLDYFPFDVGFFNDRKIRELRGKYGSDGITIYIYLLCLIYEDKGYYIKLDDGFDYVVSADLNMDNEKIGQIINFLCKRSLFDNTLFTSDKVLTSRGIQTRYQEAKKGAKRDIYVDKYWLLDENETQKHIKCTNFQSISEKNGGYSKKNYSYSEEKPYKIKESKLNKSKVEEIKELASAVPQSIIDLYQNNIAPLTPIVFHSIEDWLESMDADVIEYAIKEAAAHNKRNWRYIEAIIRNHFNAGRTTFAAVEDAARNRKRPDADASFNNDDGVDYDELEKIMREKM
ncbi:MAG: DUF4373 domain-containing protein [Oscillospiraceae bacterium]|nr:DUF4373 domain-containing protein [Oscillospiraceae bacterium]